MKIQELKLYFTAQQAIPREVVTAVRKNCRKTGVSWKSAILRCRAAELRGADDMLRLIWCLAPLYTGRVPNKMLSGSSKQLREGMLLAVPVVTFENRNFDNGLIELHNELENNGFHTVGASLP